MPDVSLTTRSGSVTITAEDAARGIRTLDKILNSEKPGYDQILEAIEAAADLREKSGLTSAMEDVVKMLDDVPAYLRVDDYSDIAALDVATIVRDLRDALPEFKDIDGYPFKLTWRKKHGSSNGDATLGTCGKVSAKVRATWEGATPAPFWEITLALDYWICATREERIRLVHHEMSHAGIDFDKEGTPKPTVKNHDVEEFVSTAGRFGPLTRLSVALADHINAHPKIAEKRREWMCDDAGQTLLFEYYEVSGS